MPARMVRDWTDSLRFEGLSAEAERLFMRLIMKADDYGRFHADPRLIKAACFPLVEVDSGCLQGWLVELSDRKLILPYEAEGRSCLVIIGFGQRLKKSRAKFPALPGKPEDWLPSLSEFREVPGSSGKSTEVPASIEEKGREYEEEENTNTKAPRAGAGGVDVLSIVNAYPRRERQAECLQIVARHIEDGEDPLAIMAGTKAIADVIRTLPSGSQNRYVAGAHGFFIGKRWQDDPETWRRRDPTGEKPPHRQGEFPEPAVPLPDLPDLPDLPNL